MRMFFALELNDEARESVDTMAFIAKGTLPGKYTKAADYHITVCYVGEIEPESLEELKEIGANAAAQFASKELTLSGSGVFKENILWAGVDNTEEYAQLAKKLKEDLRAAEFPFDPKPFKAHITIARDIRLDEFPLPEPDSVRWTVNCLTLFESTRVKGALRYLPVARFPFKA